MKLLLTLLLSLSFLAGGAPSVGAQEFKFAHYNLRNYGPLLEPGKAKPAKSEASTAAVHEIIEAIAPDILGVCEMGPPHQFEAFRARLAAAGLHYPEAELVQSVDTERHLALLSRYPIVARQSLTDLSFEVAGSRQKMRRGILDVTVAVSERVQVRILGVHLKSKLATGESEEEVRRQEAHLLRRRAEEIMANDPTVNLLVFGDFNDTKDQVALQSVAGARGAANTLLPLQLTDAQGDRWTFHWPQADLYSRIDFILVNRRLSQAVHPAGCYVYRSSQWQKASDHRPVVAAFRFED